MLIAKIGFFKDQGNAARAIQELVARGGILVRQWSHWQLPKGLTSAVGS